MDEPGPGRAERNRDRHAVVVGSVLAIVSGAIDAVTYLRVTQAFPANHSGNLILVGLSLGTGERDAALRSAVAIAAFGAGVAVAVAVRRSTPSLHPRPVLLLEGLVVAVALVLVVRWMPPSGPVPGRGAVVVLAMLSVAMGLQTEVIRRAMGVALSTTYETNAVVRLSESVSSAADPRVTGTSSTPAVVAGVLLVAYVVGATIGALGRGRPVAVIGVVLVALVAVTATAALNRSTPVRRPPGP